MSFLKNLLCFLILFCAFSSICAQETVKNIDSLLNVLKLKPADTSKAMLYQTIAAHYNVTALDSARPFAEEGIKLAKSLNFDQGEWANLNMLGNYFERKSAFDSARTTYNKALKIIERNNDTKGFAVVLNNIGMIDIREAKYDAAIERYFEALKAEEVLENQKGIAQAYNNIGVVYYYTKNFEKTTEYLTKALEIQEGLGNLDGIQQGYNNVGAIYDYQKKYDEAIVSYTKALKIARKLNNPKETASYLTNIALSYAGKEDYVNSEAYFIQSIELREEIKDFNGIAHTYSSYGESLRNQKKLEKAKKYLDEGLKIAQKYNVRLTKREILLSLSELASDKGDYKKANEYIHNYIEVKDSILDESRAKAIEEFEAKYETEKKENEILEQRALIAEKENEVNRKNNLIYGTFGLAILLGLLGYLFYNHQRLKNRQLKKEGELKTALAQIETQNKLQEQRLRISRDLHDNIGSQLTFIISSLDTLKFGAKDLSQKITDKISGISQFTSQTIYELRDTIWAMNKEKITLEDLQVRISNFIDKAKIATTGTSFVFNISEEVALDYELTSVQGMNVYRIIQEAVNNAIKYANSSQISVAVKKPDSFIFIINDNGNGFDTTKVVSGNGTNNMKKRAKDLDGILNINSVLNKGTTITLEFT